MMQEYTVRAEERHTVYVAVTAESPEDALRRWHNGEGTYQFSEFVEILPDSEEVVDE